ncbi:ATP-dependent helicase HrpB [Aestuariispira insulae]|uniref:ATP-dependent helicase HrpB n=1 Tax=Aestuariispira insulae TaxID=1461337 RepID=A0A3D9HXD8_9PROT|nr:ATP-dependent helicase HrpB [Aestuariispira insulae]RED54080.1 ATP-dependent helicase HrpB [Aestuariispira insulae]
MFELPIDPLLPDITKSLESNANLVLQAPPGAGKTTRVPLALLAASWRGNGTILMLEPRRLAARAAAIRMAQTLGEPVGKTVGYRIQLDNKVSTDTRIEVVTEGILTRRLQQDPELDGVAAVIFDEFHERSLQADLGLALCLDAQEGLREDLRLIVMSATLDGKPVAELMGNAPILTSEGRAFPVETRYLGKPPAARFGDSFTPAMTEAIKQALREETGSILCFLPGEGEIRRLQGRLESASLGNDIVIAPLFGALSQKEQDLAIAPCSTGKRKVVLATSIAETSLTIEGIRIVIDGGLSRQPRFDPQSGMGKLVTEPVSLAAASQRAGRAGRLEPGICYRLWNKAGEGAMRKFTPPEILDADLAPLALDLANWGVLDANSLKWLTPPPEVPMQQGRALLQWLGALDHEFRITAHGKAIAKKPMHPRFAHMIVRGDEMGLGRQACQVAALLGERDIVLRDGAQSAPVDMAPRLQSLTPAGGPLKIHKGALSRVKTLSKQWEKRLDLKIPETDLDDQEAPGALIALAYPDRVAERRPGKQARYRMSNGKGATLPIDDSLQDAPFLAIASVTGAGRDAQIRLAARLEADLIERLFSDQLETGETAAWDSRTKSVQARLQKKFHAVVLADAPAKTIPPEKITEGLVQGIRETGLQCLPWSVEATSLRDRIACLRLLDGESSYWPDLSDDILADTMEDWLLPYLAGKSRLEHLQDLDLVQILKSGLDWEKQQEMDRLAPSHWTVPSGSSIRLDYSNPEAPVLPVKLQEMFGAIETPTIADGRLALTIHLLSPAGRPLQVTQDLPAFWENGYKHVKAEMKGRYPKHPWPDNPLTAEPSRHTKKRMGQ